MVSTAKGGIVMTEQSLRRCRYCYALLTKDVESEDDAGACREDRETVLLYEKYGDGYG